MKLEEIINSKNISEGSKKTYLSILRRVDADGFKIPVGNSQMINRINDYIGNLQKTTQKLDVLNIIISIRNELDMNSDKIKELRDLRFQLKRCIEREDYEHAAELRDRIAEIENKKKITK